MEGQTDLLEDKGLNSVMVSGTVLRQIGVVMILKLTDPLAPSVWLPAIWTSGSTPHTPPKMQQLWFIKLSHNKQVR